MCIVRDWCGAYALFIITSGGLIGKKLTITDAFPLIDMFHIEDTTSTPGVFTLVIDENIFEIEALYVFCVVYDR